MSQRSRNEKTKNSDLRPLYARQVVNSFGSGTVTPFLSFYTAWGLHGSVSELGWLQAVSNFAPNVMQVPWGRLSDKIGRRIPFIMLGGLLTAVLWIPLMFVTTAMQLIFVVAVQSILGSMAIPTWTALIGDLSQSSKRGITTAALNRVAGFGGLLATLSSGYLMILFHGTPQEILLLPLLIAIGFGVASSLVMIPVKEKRHQNNPSKSSILDIRDVARLAKSNPHFLRFTAASMIFGFFMSVSWPLFAITQNDILHLSMLEVGLIGVLSSVVTIALQPWGGKLVDGVGRRPLIILYRSSLVLVPMLYALAANVYHLYLLNLIIGITAAFGDIALLAYLLDISNEETRGTLTAFFNLIIGTFYFVGSLVGGYLATYFIGIFGLLLGLQIVYAMSAVGRGIGAFAFMSIKEPFKYPSSLKREIHELMQRLPLIHERSPSQP